MTESAQATLSGSTQPASVLGRVRHLVESKTRFESSDITATNEEKVDQPYHITVGYGLFTTLVKSAINGNFRPGKDDLQYRNSAVLVDAAKAEAEERMTIALDKLKTEIGPQDVAYDALSDGTYLYAARQHFHLPACDDCAGEGKNLCHTCRGRCTETCPNCKGACRVRCTNSQCTNGKTYCSYCHGSGKVNEYVTEYVQVQYEVRKSDGTFSHYGHRTEPVGRNVQVPCKNYQCHYGQVTCSTCNGTTQVNCGTCGAHGRITCRSCRGDGYLICKPCSGTGKRGSAVRLEVGLGLEYAFLLPEGTPGDVQKIVSIEDTHGVPPISHYLNRNRLAFGPQGAQALYAGAFSVSRLDAVCNAHPYRVVAYGEDGRWLTLDNIVEDLLRSDLNALSQALKRIQQEGIFATDIDFLLQPLSDVTSSEINADVVDLVLKSEAEIVAAAKSVEAGKKDRAVLDEPGKAPPAGAGASSHQLVSAEYAQEIKSGVLGSLEHIYTRSAKPLSLHLLIMSMVVVILLSLFSGTMLATGVALCLIPASNGLFKRAVKKKLIKAMSSPENAVRSIAIAIGIGAHRKAKILLFVPIIAGIPLGLFVLKLGMELMLQHG